MAYEVSNAHVTDDVTWPQKCCEAVRSAFLATAWLLVMFTDAGAYFMQCSLHDRPTLSEYTQYVGVGQASSRTFQW